jgi:predicted nucleotidyltransferase
MEHQDLRFDPERLGEFCRRHGVRRLALFGSILGPGFGPQSDVDLLVEFLPGTRVGYLAMARMERELGQMLGRKVDLRTPAELSRHFRDEVMGKSVVQYCAQ